MPNSWQPVTTHQESPFITHDAARNPGLVQARFDHKKRGWCSGSNGSFPGHVSIWPGHFNLDEPWFSMTNHHPPCFYPLVIEHFANWNMAHLVRWLTELKRCWYGPLASLICRTSRWWCSSSQTASVYQRLPSPRYRGWFRNPSPKGWLKYVETLSIFGGFQE